MMLSSVLQVFRVGKCFVRYVIKYITLRFLPGSLLLLCLALVLPVARADIVTTIDVLDELLDAGKNVLIVMYDLSGAVLSPQRGELPILYPPEDTSLVLEYQRVLLSYYSMHPSEWKGKMSFLHYDTEVGRAELGGLVFALQKYISRVYREEVRFETYAGSAENPFSEEEQYVVVHAGDRVHIYDGKKYKTSYLEENNIDHIFMTGRDRATLIAEAARLLKEGHHVYVDDDLNYDITPYNRSTEEERIIAKEIFSRQEWDDTGLAEKYPDRFHLLTYNPKAKPCTAAN